ncbi:hypothetical protein [Bradyrhizobium sp. BWC-3-1]|uniref:hypothetical protein n=1 Tax=Bradyrhizobium sp. BWC-3-1 TaxID=3080012 RepID=UPI00293E0832|nr:hypothetical protein [Bradyrhizobium sp. BWC-3-1]WOH56995.1 hypothetical protein RX329_32855 [Bradyrhizobium sp. BWC-3-1]
MPKQPAEPNEVSLSPLAILNTARNAVPAVDYALGAAGVAAAAAIIIGLLGNGQATLIILGAMLVAMLLLFAFAQLVRSKSDAVVKAGTALLWGVTIFFFTFLSFTVTAVAFDWPPTWARVLGLATDHGRARIGSETNSPAITARDDGADLVVTELRVVPVGPIINGPRLWLQPQTNVSPEYLGYRLQATIRKKRTEAIESCDAQAIDKNDEAGYCVEAIESFAPQVQQVIRTVLCKVPSVNYTSKTKFRIVCTKPGVISPWFPIELPDRATAVER